MKLGFVSAIFPDLSLEEVIQFAAQEGFSCVELMCWPRGKAVRRYAGVTHIDVTDFKKSDVKPIQALLRQAGVSISGLGYYPNPLTPDAKRHACIPVTLKRSSALSFKFTSYSKQLICWAKPTAKSTAKSTLK